MEPEVSVAAAPDAPPADATPSNGTPAPDTSAALAPTPSEPPAQPDTTDTGEPAAAEDAEPAAPETPAAEPDAEAEPAPKDEDLAEVYRQHPELKEVFKAHPQLRSHWFKALEINKVFPGGVEDASRAKDWAMQLYNFDTQFFGSEPGKRQFLQALWDNSLDESKRPTGHYEQLAGIVTGDALGNLEQLVAQNLDIAQAANLTPDQAKLAIRYVKTMLGLGNARATQQPGGEGGGRAQQPNLENDPRFSELTRREAELRAREDALRVQDESTFYDGIQKDFNGWLEGEVDKKLKPASALATMKPGFQTWVRSTIKQRIGDALRNDRFFEAQVNALVRSGNRSPEHTSAIRTELERRARQVLPNIARDVLNEAGVQAVAAQDTRNTRLDAAASRREPTTTASPGRITGPRQRPKITGDWNRDANAILGIE